METLAPSCIFPQVGEREHPALEAEYLHSDLTAFQNYASLDEWPEAAQEQVGRLASMGYVDVFGTIESMTTSLGETPVLSKPALISKQRSYSTCERVHIARRAYHITESRGCSQ